MAQRRQGPKPAGPFGLGRIFPEGGVALLDRRMTAARRSAPCLEKNADPNAGVRIVQRFLNIHPRPTSVDRGFFCSDRTDSTIDRTACQPLLRPAGEPGDKPGATKMSRNASAPRLITINRDRGSSPTLRGPATGVKKADSSAAAPVLGRTSACTRPDNRSAQLTLGVRGPPADLRYRQSLQSSRGPDKTGPAIRFKRKHLRG